MTRPEIPVTLWAMHSDHHRVVIAGGGVAAFEAALALRAEPESGGTWDITIVTAERELRYRPLSTGTAFSGDPVPAYPLDPIAERHDLRLVDGAIASVDPDARVARTVDGAELPYDSLLIAVGAERH